MPDGSGRSVDCCIVGGGIIALSIARELAGRGLSVRVLARGAARDTASWAAVGIFPPAPRYPGCPPNAALTAWSDDLHRTWAADLLAETGIDNGLRRCGGLHLAANSADRDRLRDSAAEWRAKGARCELLGPDDVAACEPAVRQAVERTAIAGGLLLPDEQRFRPPRHLQALERSCLGRGVTITRGASAREFVRRGGQVDAVIADVDGHAERVQAGAFVLAAGAWTGGLVAGLGAAVETRPIRGQIVLLELPRQVLTRIVNSGLDYLVPREDGHLLVGSTIEDAGFEPVTTPDAVARLRHLARDLLGPIADRPPAAVWAGLRPGSADGTPFIGRLPGLDNAVIATGHFRAGLHQSPATAMMVADILTDRPCQLDPAPFAPDRGPTAPTADSVATYLARAAAATGT